MKPTPSHEVNRIGVLMILTLSVWNTSSKPAVNLVSLSQSRIGNSAR